MAKRKKFEPPDLPIVEDIPQLKRSPRSWRDMSAQERVDIAQANSAARQYECSQWLDIKPAKLSKSKFAIHEYDILGRT